MTHLFRFMVLGFVIGSSVSIALAADAPPVEGFEWLNALILFISGIPQVGPILAVVFKVAVTVSAIATALAAFLIGLFGALGAWWPGSSKWKDGVIMVRDKVLPWLKWLSSFNTSDAEKSAMKATLKGDQK